MGLLALVGLGDGLGKVGRKAGWMGRAGGAWRVDDVRGRAASLLDLACEEEDEADVVKGLIAGAVGGMVGAWMMNRYHTLASGLQDDGGEEEQGGREADGHEIGGKEEQDGSEEKMPATEKMAVAVSDAFGHEMEDPERQAAGQAVHYGFGASMGAMYGVMAERVPGVRTGMGSAYGAGVWLVADEGMVPAFGLAKPPHKHPMSVHVNALLSHLVFGLTLEVVRRVLRGLMK